MGGAPEAESRQASRERLSRIGHHFLSEDRRRPHLSLFTRADDPDSLHAIDLARALARLGKGVTVIEPGLGTMLHFRLLPDADTYSVTGTRRELRGGQDRQTGFTDTRHGSTITIIDSTTTARIDPASFALLAIPADATGMRRAWLDLKALASDSLPSAIGVTITGAATLEDADCCYGRFAAAVDRFLGLEPVSYACLLRDRQNRALELRNIAALLIADLHAGADASMGETQPEETR
jgi:hypothetical protein